MKKLLIATAIVSGLSLSTLSVAKAADAGDIAAGALVGGVLGYAIGQSNNPYNTPYYGYGYSAPYGYTPGYGSYYGYEAPVTPAYGVTCSTMAGSQVVTDQWGRTVGVQCPNGTVQYYDGYGY